jgi:hypothetical protein
MVGPVEKGSEVDGRCTQELADVGRRRERAKSKKVRKIRTPGARWRVSGGRGA